MSEQQQQKIGGPSVDFLPSVRRLGYWDGIRGHASTNPSPTSPAGVEYSVGYIKGANDRWVCTQHQKRRA